MPCDEKRLVTVNLAGLNSDLVNSVIAELMLPIEYRNGELVSRRPIREEMITKIKTLYARKAIKKLAKTHGWTVKETASDQLELAR